MLPFMPLKLTNSTGVALQGVTRKGGSKNDDQELSNSRMRLTAPLTTNPASGVARLVDIAAELRAPSSSGASLPRRWQASFQRSMTHKQQMYTRERNSILREVGDAQAKAAAFVRQARSGGDDALADAQTSTWDVAEKVSGRWQSLVLQSASLDRIVQAARQRYDVMNNSANFGTLRGEFAFALETLAADYGSSLPVLVDGIADLVDAFIKQPLVASTSFLNWVLLGSPGVGKTRLARCLARVLGKLGLLVYDQLVECGRSDFIAEYEGQTAVKSRGFLVSNLEKVIFLDEAYSLTTWETAPGQDESERRLSGYSGEAVSEIVGFLSQRAGSVSFVAAGYEKEMLNDFLPANPGLDRRFTSRVWLSNYDTAQLIEIYLTALATVMSEPPPSPSLTRDTTGNFFTDLAIKFLTDILEGSRNAATHPLLERIFAAQAGSMTTLANLTALLIASSKRGGQVGTSATGVATWAISFTDVYTILSTLLQQQLGPQADEALREVQTIAKVNGWLVGDAWQVPPELYDSRLSSKSPGPARARKRKG